MSKEKSFNKILETIRAIVNDISLESSNKTPSVDDDLFSSGQLDSVVLVGLLGEIEEKFNIQIPPEDFTPENFSTIRGMATLVAKISESSDRHLRQ